MKWDRRFEQKLGSVNGVRLYLRPSALLGSLVLWLLFRQLGERQLGLDEDEAQTAAFWLTAGHWLGDFWHQMGHANAAQTVGYPMRSLRFMHVLMASTYPRDEPPLPPDTHIKRAWGGVQVSLPLGIVAGMLGMVIRPFNHYWGSILLAFAAQNLFIFTVGALIPTPILETDGNTLIKWYRAKM